MPAYNAGRYIYEAIESIRCQSFQNFELLIVDDGSTDDTLHVIKSFSDTRIRIIQNKVNKGLVYTRNIALTEAKGDFMAILDSDDIALSNRLEKQYETFLQRPDLAVLGSQAYVIDKDGNRTGRKITNATGAELVKSTIFFENPFVHSSVMMRTSVFKEFGGYHNYSTAEDYELFIRISDKYEVDNLTEYLVEYRVHGDNISTTQLPLLQQAVLDMKADQLKRLGIANDLAHCEMVSLQSFQNKYMLKDYFKLYKDLLYTNRKNNFFEIHSFEKVLFDRWFNVIMNKGDKTAFLMLFKPPLFDWSKITPRQFRKTFKKSLKEILYINKISMCPPRV